MRGTAALAGVGIGEGFPVRIMAAINVSPESFYSGSVRHDAAALREAAQQAVEEGADVLDIGAMSTAPYLDNSIPMEEERRRMAAALEVVSAAVDVPIAADTARAPVAAAALASGARIINDVTGLRGDAAMAEIAAQAHGVVLMASPDEEPDVPPLPRIRWLLSDSLQRAARAGIRPEEIVLDPGIGFFTQTGLSPVVFTCVVLHRLRELADLGQPMLVGVSRKSFIGTLTGRADPADRLAGSLGATAVAVYNGAAVIRTHDVGATRDVVRVVEAIRREGSGSAATSGDRCGEGGR